MTDIIWVAIIGAIPVTLGIVVGAIGKTASYLIDKVQKQSETTIAAKDTEIEALKDKVEIRDNRIELLEGKLRKEGIDP